MTKAWCSAITLQIVVCQTNDMPRFIMISCDLTSRIKFNVGA